MSTVARAATHYLMLCCLSVSLACGANDVDDHTEVTDEEPISAPADSEPEAVDDSDSEPMRTADAGAKDARASAPDAQTAPSDARAPQDSGQSAAAALGDAAPANDAASSDASASDPDDPCEPSGDMLAGQTSGGRGDGFIEMQVQPPNEYTRLRTTMVVGAKPAKSGTVFVWPGFQPLRAGMNFTPIGNGVLQPVLGWGPACAPGGLRDYSSWWISAMYVNTNTREPGYGGCYGSKILRVEPRDVLDVDIELEGKTWVQRVHNERTGETIEYSIDLKGQQQNRALFWIELPGGTARPVEDAEFGSVVLTTKMPAVSACNALARGGRDFLAKPRFSKDKLHCCVDRLVLRANGVTATSTP